MNLLQKLSTITAILVSIANANQADIPLDNDKIINAYKLGAFHIISELDRNIGQQGYEETSIRLKKYIVAKTIDDSFSTVDLLLLQRMAYSEGLTPLFIKGYFVFDSFDRKADAEYLLNDILKKSYFAKDNKTIQIIDNSQNNEYFKKAFLYKKLYDKLMQEVKSKYEGKVVVIEKVKQEVINIPRNMDVRPIVESKPLEEKVEAKKTDKDLKNGKVVEKTDSEIKKNVVEKKKEAQPEVKTRHFRFKPSLNQVVFYKSNGGIMNYKRVYKIAEMEAVKTSKNDNSKYEFQNIVNTDVGTQFIKVLNKLYFVDINDVEILD